MADKRHIQSHTQDEAKGALRIPDSVLGRLVFSQDRAPKIVRRFLPTDSQSPILSLNTVCPYYTMFPLEFPLRRLAKANTNEWVLDPFCGRGTTLFAARLLGLGCVGIDSNPIAAAIAAAKLAYTTSDAVVGKARSILTGAYTPLFIPAGGFWDLCYHPDTLKEICILRERLMKSCETAEEVVLRALLLGILHGPRHRGLPTYLSNQMPRTYATKPNAAVRYWRRTNKTEPPRVDVLDAVKRRAEYSLRSIPPPSEGAVYFGDSQRTDEVVPPSRRFNWVVTSPPYFGMRTYRPDQWLRNWFLGGADAVDYSQEGQISHSAEKFAKELSEVWKSVAKRCSPGARLIIRFGYLPSVPVDAREILRMSLNLADSGWRIRRWVDAGSANNGKRQSKQFGRVMKTAASEVDVYARLEG
ncbi:DNA methyltransferase [Desulfatirhabdium butyrativorans]|uniref:DNA methyltransferase n=1 Tax=Desulfatirhabdium butyrativorans TaxID=340467 RepID=UPI00040BD9C9|nr:DNA methyltransferase [Desulfatirhabdium butyrativorans]